ncbi:hypothetical protein [Streptomyces bluensis]|uniref:Uncharacterized protein n=1 Tax=Streptomyces bluensis TaxID=33897 RepID=A0ABW6UHN8_9ACTN
MREAVRLGREVPAESYDVVFLSLGIMAAKRREETVEVHQGPATSARPAT